MAMGSWSAAYVVLVIIVVAAPAALACLLARKALDKKGVVKPRSPPGPPGLPILGNLLTLQGGGLLPHRTLHKLAEEYGPVMGLRLGVVPAVVLSSSDAAQLFLVTHDHAFAKRPGGDRGKYLITYAAKGMVLADYGPHWRGVRNLCNVHVLCSRKVDSFRSVRRDEVDLLVRSIRNAAAAGGRAPVDISARVSATVIDVTCRTLFGKKCQEAWGLDKIFRVALELMGSFNAADYVPCVGALDVQGIRRRMKAVGKAFDDFFEAVIHEHVLGLKEGKKPEKDFDVLDTMLSSAMSSDGGHILDDRSSMKAALMDLINGAVDSTEATVEWAMTELLRHPRVMRKLQQELEASVGLGRMVKEEDLAKLSYLDMVVKEAMRLHPPFPLIARETRDDCTVGGFHIKRGTHVLVNLWAIGRDPTRWDDADTFFPERFAGRGAGGAGDEGAGDLAIPVFGWGSRRCPGAHMSLTLARMVVAQLVHCFNWEIPGGVPHGQLDAAERFALVITRAKHLLAVPTYRLHGGAD